MAKGGDLINEEFRETDPTKDWKEYSKNNRTISFMRDEIAKKKGEIS